MVAFNTLLPLVGPPCPSRLLPRFSAQKEHELFSFQSIPFLIIVEGSLEVKLPTIWTDEKQSRAEAERRERLEERRVEEKE